MNNDLNANSQFNNTEPPLTADEIKEMRQLIKLSQSAKLVWGAAVGLVSFLGGVYAVLEHFKIVK